MCRAQVRVWLKGNQAMPLLTLTLIPDKTLRHMHACYNPSASIF
jgi:hypothetical protein